MDIITPLGNIDNHARRFAPAVVVLPHAGGSLLAFTLIGQKPYLIINYGASFTLGGIVVSIPLIPLPCLHWPGNAPSI